MLQLAFSIVLMLAVVGGLSHWMIRKDKRNRALAGDYRRMEFGTVETTEGKERHARDHR